MPEVNITVELPDGTTRHCYSPSSVVRTYFEKGDTLKAPEFCQKSRSALTEASARVKQKFGFECTAAASSLREIESWTAELAPDDLVTITSI